MPKVALEIPEIKAEFPLEVVVKIRSLQIELEKFCCNKINRLALKAKQDNKLEISKVYYKACASRMLNLRRLQKQQEQEQKAIVKQTARLEKARAKSITKPEAKVESLIKELKAKAITSVNNNVSELRQVC
ncbi:MAG: hypothetical protein WAQ98_10085 [Blastocatellia bacterium]